MKGHALPGPNQKASIGKSLQDYQMRDGELVPISTDEYDKIFKQTGKQTLVGDVSKSKLPIGEGGLVSDKMTAEARKASGDGTYKVDGNLLQADNVDKDYYDYNETDEARNRRMNTYKSEYQGIDSDGNAVYEDVEKQKKINELAAQRIREGDKNTVADKKMKFGRKKK